MSIAPNVLHETTYSVTELGTSWNQEDATLARLRVIIAEHSLAENSQYGPCGSVLDLAGKGGTIQDGKTVPAGLNLGGGDVLLKAHRQGTIGI